MKQKRIDTLGLPDNMVASQMVNRRASGLPPLFSGKLVALLLVVVIVILLAWYLPKYLKQHLNKGVEVPKGMTTVPVNRLPNGFPPDLPYLDAKAVLHNFSVSEGAVEGAGVRQWQVAAASDAVAGGFVEYFKKFGWEITTNASVQGRTILSAAKGKQLLSVSVKPAPDGGSLIEVTFRETSE